MKYVEIRGKIIAYEICLQALGVDIRILFDGQTRPNQKIDFELDDQIFTVKVWDLPMKLYRLLTDRIKYLGIHEIIKTKANK